MTKKKSTAKDQAPKKIRKRKTTKELVDQFTCPYDICGKTYGCETSLNLHIQIKHNGGSKGERYQLAQKIIIAYIRGTLDKIVDEINLNLPPGDLSKVAKYFGLPEKTESKALQQIYQLLKMKQHDFSVQDDDVKEEETLIKEMLF